MAISRREPWAIWLIAIAAGLAFVWGFIAFAKRPLGGDPDKPPIGDDDFRDARNPYRNLGE